MFRSWGKFLSTKSYKSKFQLTATRPIKQLRITLYTNKPQNTEAPTLDCTPEPSAEYWKKKKRRSGPLSILV